MSDLLSSDPRITKSVKLTSRTVLVRQLTAVEFLAIEGAIEGIDEKSTDGRVQIMAKKLAAFLSNEDGSQALTEDQARQFASTYTAIDVRRVMRAGAALNTLSEEMVESAEKN